MAEQVTGIIGQEQVFLNNAASEATLRLLLEATKSSNKEVAVAIDRMAAKAGIDSEAITAANTAIKASSTSFKGLNNSVDTLTPSFNQLNTAAQQLTGGMGKASALLELSIGRTSGALGMFATGLILAVKFQEDALNSYRQLSQAGVSFSGSLTDMRMAAANSYMSMENFAKLMSDNRQELLALGGSVNGGAVAFAKFSNSMLKSELGDHFLALGYSADEANQAMLTYLGATGASNKEDLASNKALREGAAAYLEELDRLADLTGKSRQEQEQTMKKLQLDADVQTTLARMPEKARREFLANVKYMSDQYGDAGKEIALAQAQGRSVRTKEAQTLLSLAPGIESAYKSMAGAKMGSEEYKRAQHEMSLATQRGMNQFDAATLGYVKGIDQAKLATAREQIAGLTSQQAFDEFEAKRDAEKKARDESQAKAAAETEKSLKELGQNILELMLPAVNKVLGVFNALVETISKHKSIILELIAVLAAYKAAQIASFALGKIKEVKQNGLASTLKNSFGAGVGTLGSKTNPMYVIIVGGGGGGGLEDLLEGKGKGKKSFKTGAGAPANRASRLAKVASGRAAQAVGKAGGSILNGLKGGIGGMVGGIALDLAGDYAKEKGYQKTGAGLDVAGEALSGAGTGAMIGSIIPGIGTAVGGAVGGALGGMWGLYKNWDTFFKSETTKKPGEEGQPPEEGEQPKMAEGGIVNKQTSLIAGEAGPEAIIPLSTLNRSFSSIANQAVQLNGTTGAQQIVSALKPMTKEAQTLLSLGNQQGKNPFDSSEYVKAIEQAKKSKNNTIDFDDIIGTKFSNLFKPLENLKEPKSNISSLIPSFETVVSTLKNVSPAGILLDNIGEQLSEVIGGPTNGTKPAEEKTVAQLEILNKTILDLVKYMKDTADNTDKTHRATTGLSGKLW